ncbi:ABC transporter ATP-binding protein [Ignavigranum ruoffiae]|uniref:ATP-binding cassette, subfamily B, tetracycline resistant protein n=1 Tax=Ignavigranum ruoffiae TaxID=89093 RepID=A0A1H8YWE2_9LACT|nr:ABC transporter ATP-binding protein [Ignavigranum ruoffiae]SEP56383.1 ATP-binding cassette, subfamily B, tetracycline resistant protein [Ignavigranum ruoffiae]
MINSLWKFIKENPKVYLLGVFLAVIGAGFYVTNNYMIQLFVDGIVAASLTWPQLKLYASIFALVALANYVNDLVLVRILFKQSYLFQNALRMKTFERLLTFKKPFFQSFRSGDLMTRLTSDVDQLGNTMTYGVLLIIVDGLWMLMLLTYLIVMVSWRLTLISVFPLVFFGLGVFFLGKVVDQRYTESRDAVAELSNQVLEVVEGVRVMRAYGRRDLEQAKFQEKTQAVTDKFNHLYLANALYTPLIRFFSGLSVLVSIGYGSQLVSQADMSVGQLVAFQIYLGMFLYTIWGISDIFALYQTGKVSFRKIQEIIEHDNPVEASGQQALETFDKITFDDYYFTYPSEAEPTLKGISLALKKGQTLGIVGKTGSGKTTLIAQFLRQYPVDQEGRIMINDQAIQSYRIQEIEGLIGYVPQDHVLFSKTVRENILFGNDQAGEEEFNQAVAGADFQKDISHLSQGFDTLIGEKGVAISGGQKQRVSIARALIRQPELLILDDSLSAVDAKTEQAIIHQIQNIRRGKTNIIVTHRLSAVMEADSIIVLDDGRIIEQGSAQELLMHHGWFKEQFDRQQMEGKS